MTAAPFRIIEHVFPCQHIRDYPGATATEQEQVLSLSVKQYVPVDNPNPQPGDITIIGAHANAFPKELYEPLWEEINNRAKAQGFRIRGIWMADVAHQGHSGVLNENVLGNDPSWLDHPRDLLHFINLKRDEMPRPIFGIGHSMGGCQLANLALIHPRLFTSLVLLDPVIARFDTEGHAFTFHTQGRSIPVTTAASTYRRDIWPSRSAATETLKRNKFYQSWDPRVLDRWIKYGLRDLPTAIHPLPETSKAGDAEIPVTLSTTLHQEVFTFSRPNYSGDPALNLPVNRATHPDLIPNAVGGYPFYRSEAHKTFLQLPYLRPSVLYVFADQSDISLPEFCEAKMQTTGTGMGGSGGAVEGRVKSVTLKGVGHLIAMEAVGQTADLAAGWLGTEMGRWRDEERVFREEWNKKSKVEKMTIDEEWKRHVPPPKRRNGNGGEKKAEAKL
ncbi:hypothetical protein AJ80_06765 [Polytolypa hystricis UAMH7299]|uniref:AB hydrolase-1 domain-containing protein n=1 Tax=Polytolypa hystricis (strain UAMH7299) TaxID=1447883 RepID=A0A2B7XTU8_POLH7|nr:hypothetical protein AJ80_06765 [Polytolypa hystricis UAMH7299]